jgi:signal transduction histidine kinase/CheY-like chemotaxis protein
MPIPPHPESDTFATPVEGGTIRALVALGERLTGAIHVSTAVQHTAEAITRQLTPDALLIALVDPADGRLVTAFAHQYVTPPADDPIVRLVIRDGPRVLTRVTDADRERLRITDAQSIAAIVAAPIRGAGQSIGAIVAASETPARYGAAHGEFLAGAAAQLGLALANARLIDLLAGGKREWEGTVDALGLAFCVLSQRGTIRRANRAFSDLVRMPVTALAGESWEAVLPPEWVAPITPLLAARDPAQTMDVRSPDRAFTASAYDLGGAEGLAVLVFEDQTEKRRLQAQLIQSEKMAAVGQLIAGVAHDLNNPLASVVGFADYLVEETQDAPPSLRKPLEAIRQEAERAASIVRGLLTFARKHEGQRRAAPIAPVLKATLQLLNNQLIASKVGARLDVDADLPPVEIDPTQIQQVFVNLISNAAHAIAGTGVGDTITVQAERWPGGVAVTVADNGPGMPRDVAERIFEPFFTTKAEGEGTGLGLSICQGILKEHGGRITYAPVATGGASFRVELPSGQPAADAPTTTPRDPGRLRILVIDDEPHILHYMHATLEAWGHLVTVSEDCEEALAKTMHEAYDVIISDLRMPGLGGRAFYERLRADRPGLAGRVVFSTGDTVRGDVLEFLETAGRPWLRKPFTLAELREVLARV